MKTMQTVRFGACVRGLVCGVAFLTALGAVALGCAVDATGSASTPGATQGEVAAHPVDGEAAIRGIYFGQGEVAARLPELWEKPALDGTPAPAADETIARVRASSPGVVERFGTELASGDVVRVRAALVDMTNRLREGAPSGRPSSDRLCVIFDIPVLLLYYPYVAVIVGARASDAWRQGGLSQDDVAQHIADRFAPGAL